MLSHDPRFYTRNMAEPKFLRSRHAQVWRAAFRSLGYRNFRLFAGGQLISLIGTWMQSVAQAWLVYRLTESAALLGAIGFASQIPVFLLGPVGGIVADRYNRHRVVVATQAASMLLASILAALTLAGWVAVWHLFVLAALLGVVNAIDIPARQAFLVDMVGRKDLVNAIALNSTMFNGARIVGPAVAGMLVAWVGEAWCFLINAVSYIAVIAGLLMMDVAPRQGRPPEGPALERVVEGFRFVIHHAPVHSLLLLLGVVSAAGAPYVVLMPIFAEDVLHSGASGLGLLMGASGVGAVAGALLLAARVDLSGLGRMVAFAGAGFGMALVAFALSKAFWLSMLALLPVGFCLMLQMGACNTLVQSMTPDHLRGRVMAAYSMMFMGLAPLGSLIAGMLADRLGAPFAVGLGGAVTVAGAVFFAARLPALRPEARRLIVAQEMAAGSPAQEVTGGGLAVDSQNST